MSTAGLTIRQVRYTNKAFWRNPQAAFFTFVFPLMFLVIFDLLFGDQDIGYYARDTGIMTYYVPAIVAFAVITACFTNMAISISLARDRGELKRLRGTPLPGDCRFRTDFSAYRQNGLQASWQTQAPRGNLRIATCANNMNIASHNERTSHNGIAPA